MGFEELEKRLNYLMEELKLTKEAAKFILINQASVLDDLYFVKIQ